RKPISTTRRALRLLLIGRRQESRDELAHLRLLPWREGGAEEASDLRLVRLERGRQRALAGCGERHAGSAAVGWIRLTRDQPPSLDPVDELARPTHRDAKRASKVADAHAAPGRAGDEEE